MKNKIKHLASELQSFRASELARGFTLIEILVVVAIIAILASVVLIGLGPTRRAGRDARRIADLRQVQNGLELYFNHCGVYPGGSSGVVGCAGAKTLTGSSGYTTASTDLTTAGITAQPLPNDPTNTGSFVYSFYSNPTTPGTGYLLTAVLEDSGNPALKGQVPITPYTPLCGLNGLYCLTL